MQSNCHCKTHLQSAQKLIQKFGGVWFSRLTWHGFFVLLSILVCAPAQALVNTPASWAVSPSGAFTYDIPMRLPPGIAGVQPKISLSYNSQSGNGIAGTGWTLSGLSAITRCPRTLTIDGVRGSVNMNSNDRLCLDGQRLLLQSGTYGAEGATYTTEQHNGSKIIGTALTGSNARSFKVYTKAGEIMEYTPFNIPTNNLALQFVLSKVTDAKSNYWQVHYQSNIVQGEIYPKAICYTGNSRLNQVPKNCIEFGYGADTSRYTTPIVRSDASLGFGAGFAFLSSQRLSGIRTLINATATPSGNSWTIAGTPVTDYKLTYSAFNPIDRTLLKSVEECSPTACLTAQTFLYNEQGSIALENTNGNYNPPYPYLWGGVPQAADFNGDGRTDFFIVTGSPSTNVLSILISKGDGTFADTFTNYPRGYGDGEQPSPYPPLEWLGNFSADFNGDGKTDLISLTWAATCGDGVASSTYQVWLSNGDGTFRTYP